MDTVQTLLDVTCTVFQRMNPAGDMLRISTNVIKTNGKRAIGTYIPAINPNGNRNPVISKVLKGETFNGRAFIVNAWYITAYEPIFDAARNVVGVLYVGIPQENVKSLRRAIMEMKIGDTGFVTVIDSSGKYTISNKGQKDGQDALNVVDAKGTPYIKERIESAKALGPREIGGQVFIHKEDDGTENVRDARFVYFKPWDWVITAEADTAEFTKASNLLKHLGKKSNMILGLVGLIAMFVTSFVWFFVARSLVKPINAAIFGLKDIAEGEGDLTMRLQASSRDEIGELVFWFNTFIEKLQGIIGQIGEDSRQVETSSTELSAIASQIEDVQNTTTLSIKEINEISQVINGINGINDIVATIAASVEEQSAATKEIADNINQASLGISEVNENINQSSSVAEAIAQDITHVNREAGKMSLGSEQVKLSAEGLNDMSKRLTEIVGRFKV